MLKWTNIHISSQHLHLEGKDTHSHPSVLHSISVCLTGVPKDRLISLDCRVWWKYVWITWKQFQQKLMCVKTSERQRKVVGRSVRLWLRQASFQVTSLQIGTGSDSSGSQFQIKGAGDLDDWQLNRRRPWWKSLSSLKLGSGQTEIAEQRGFWMKNGLNWS